MAALTRGWSCSNQPSAMRWPAPRWSRRNCCRDPLPAPPGTWRCCWATSPTRPRCCTRRSAPVASASAGRRGIWPGPAVARAAGRAARLHSGGRAGRPVAIGDRELMASMVAVTGAIEITVHGWDIAVACGPRCQRPGPVPGRGGAGPIHRRHSERWDGRGSRSASLHESRSSHAASSSARSAPHGVRPGRGARAQADRQSDHSRAP